MYIPFPSRVMEPGPSLHIQGINWGGLDPHGLHSPSVAWKLVSGCALGRNAGPRLHWVCIAPLRSISAPKSPSSVSNPGKGDTV